MEMSKIPKPLIYAISTVVIAIGVAIAYRVVIGSEFSYDGQLGSIKIGSGEDETTLDNFLAELQEALTTAQSTIADQDQQIARLKKALEKYQSQTRKMQELAAKITRADSIEQRSTLRTELSSTVANLNREQVDTNKFIVTDKGLSDRKKVDSLIAKTKAVNLKIAAETKTD